MAIHIATTAWASPPPPPSPSPSALISLLICDYEEAHCARGRYSIVVFAVIVVVVCDGGGGGVQITGMRLESS